LPGEKIFYNKGINQTVKIELQISHLTDWALVHVRYRPKHCFRIVSAHFSLIAFKIENSGDGI
jgi:hypothetical protein